MTTPLSESTTTTTDTSTTSTTSAATSLPTAPALKLELVVVPVADVDRAKAFYERLGWTLDVDLVVDDTYRVVEFTPPGSPASIIVGTGVTDAAPGSARGLHLVTRDIEATRADLLARGVEVSDVFHDVGGVFHRADPATRATGLAPGRASYGSFVELADPDGNTWTVQEITERIPGRVTQARYDSAAELADALRAAAAAHGEHEARTGQEDANWPDWYAEYLVRVAAGQQPPE
ncbi:VOC family protein [Isoptericola sp. NPDC019693]|uniref:VOC family protein n=1 Tax=Isoptericola sp. NPDC019693 TaxID=3364009 RepID=UPI00379359BA